jgi:circadian clock protein KaiB
MPRKTTKRIDSSAAEEMRSTAAALERAAAAEADVHYVLHLYVTGMTPRSQHAIENIRTLCEEHLAGRYELKIVDIYQQPELARGAQIIAAPTLVKSLPLPLRRLIGDMSDEGRVLVALGVKVAEKGE